MIFGILFTLIIGVVIFTFWQFYYSELDQNFKIGMLLCIIGCVFESMCEPLLTQYILNFEYQIGAKSEAIAVFSKTIFLFLLTKANIFHTLVNFGLCQMLQSQIMLISIAYFTKIEGKDYYIMPEMKEMGYQFTLISLFKMLSQELEKIVLITFTSNTQASSEFLIVSNIGSMIPRYIYAPIEDICFNLFAKISLKNKEVEDIQQLNKQSKNPNFQQQNILSVVLKLINLIGFFAIFFGIPYASAFLQLLYGEKWNYPSCIAALQYYCIYEWVMGINGISESFVQGSIQKSDLESYRIFVLLSTLFYAIFCSALAQYGSGGIILSSIFGMSIRIIVSFCYISKLIFSKNVKELVVFIYSTLPNVIFCALCFGSLFVRYFVVSSIFVSSPLYQLLIGIGMAFLILLYCIKIYGKEFNIFFQNRN